MITFAPLSRIGVDGHLDVTLAAGFCSVHDDASGCDKDADDQNNHGCERVYIRRNAEFDLTLDQDRKCRRVQTGCEICDDNVVNGNREGEQPSSQLGGSYDGQSDIRQDLPRPRPEIQGGFLDRNIGG